MGSTHKIKPIGQLDSANPQLQVFCAAATVTAPKAQHFNPETH